MQAEISFELNGAAVTAMIDPYQRLIAVLRDTLGQTGTKEGCREGECGACTVLVDGRAVHACLYPAPEIEGRKVTTIEGLEHGRQLSALQSAFVEMAGTQCGFCAPGMIMSAVALLGQNADPDDEAIREALTGNLCRCTGYVQIIDSIRRAAQTRRQATS